MYTHKYTSRFECVYMHTCIYLRVAISSGLSLSSTSISRGRGPVQIQLKQMSTAPPAPRPHRPQTGTPVWRPYRVFHVLSTAAYVYSVY